MKAIRQGAIIGVFLVMLMAVAMVITGGVAYYVGNSPELLVAIFASPLKWVAMFAYQIRRCFGWRPTLSREEYPAWGGLGSRAKDFSTAAPFGESVPLTSWGKKDLDAR